MVVVVCKALHRLSRGRGPLLAACALCWLLAAMGGAWALNGNGSPGALLPELHLRIDDAVLPTLDVGNGTSGQGTVEMPVLGRVQLDPSGPSKLSLKAFSYLGKSSGQALGLAPTLGLQGLPGGSLGRALGRPLDALATPLAPDDRATQVKAEYGGARAKFAVGFTDIGAKFPTAVAALQGVDAADLEALKQKAGTSSLDLSGLLRLGSAATFTSARTYLRNDKPGDGNRGLTTTEWVNALAINVGKNSALKLSLTDHDESWDPGSGKQGTKRTTTQVAWDTTFGKGGQNSIKFGLTDTNSKSGDQATSERTQELHVALAPASGLRLTADSVIKGNGDGKSTTTNTFGTVMKLAAGSELTANLKSVALGDGKQTDERYLKLTSDLGHGTSAMKLFAEQKLTSTADAGDLKDSKFELTGGFGAGGNHTNLHALFVESRGEGATGKLERTTTVHLDRKLGKRFSLTADREEVAKGTLEQPNPTAKTAVSVAAALNTQTTLTAGLTTQQIAGARFTSQDLIAERKVGELLVRAEEHRRDDPAQAGSTGYMVDLPKGKIPQWAAGITRKHVFDDVYDYYVAKEASWLDLPFAGFRFWAKQRRGGSDGGLDTRLLSYRGMLARRVHFQFTSQERPEAEEGDAKGRPQDLRRQYAELGTLISDTLVGRGWLMNERSLTDAKSRRRTLGLGLAGTLPSGAQTEVDYSQTRGSWDGKAADRQALAMLYARKIDDENQVAVKIACAWGDGLASDAKNPEYRLSLQYKKPI